MTEPTAAFAEGAPRPGAEFAGFRLERVIGRGPHGVVYEATQHGLDRRVALKLLTGSERRGGLAWPDGPHVVSMYAAGAWEQGRFVAMRLVPGSTSMATLQARGALAPARARELLEQVAAALDAAHAAGIAHGDVKAANVLVGEDGQALLSDFGQATDRPDAAADRRAFAVVVREALGQHASSLESPLPGSALAIVQAATRGLPSAGAASAPHRRRARLLALGALFSAALAAALSLALAGGNEPAPTVPPVLPNTRSLGSALPAGSVSSVDCQGRPASGSSPACTVVQLALRGRPVVPTAGGVIRRWTVRGARGTLALRVLRRRGTLFQSPGRGDYVEVPDEGVHAFAANVPVRAGDRVGLEVAPGAAIGVRSTAGGATTGRWLGPVSVTPRAVERGPETGFDHELLLRLEYEPGAAAKLDRLQGRSAERAPAGRLLQTREIDLRDGQHRTLAAVRLPGSIAIDLFDGRRRLARLAVTDADARGKLVEFIAFGGPLALLRWRNPDGRPIVHEYAVTTRSITPRG